MFQCGDFFFPPLRLADSLDSLKRRYDQWQCKPKPWPRPSAGLGMGNSLFTIYQFSGTSTLKMPNHKVRIPIQANLRLCTVARHHHGPTEVKEARQAKIEDKTQNTSQMITSKLKFVSMEAKNWNNMALLTPKMGKLRTRVLTEVMNRNPSQISLSWCRDPLLQSFPLHLLLWDWLFLFGRKCLLSIQVENIISN